MKFSSGFAATAAFFTSASAVSTFAVVNRCEFDIYLWHVEGGSAPSQMFTLPGGHPEIGYSETYKYVSPYAGVSLKVAPYYVGSGQIPPPSINVTQLEYTVPPPGSPSSIWYDLSMVNGNAFMGIPFTYSPSSPDAGDNCVTDSCNGDYELCTAGYNFPTDDSHTHTCSYEQDIIFTFCNGNSQKPLLVPTGLVTVNQFQNLTCINGGACDPAAVGKREVEPEPEPQAETDADPLAVCYSAAAANAGEGVPILAALCPDATSSTPAPVPSTSSSSTAAPTASAVAALQQPAQAPTTTSSSSAAPAPTQAAASPAAPAGPPTSPLSQLQLSSLANTGVTCWLSYDSSQTCGPSKRNIHEHSRRHDHMAFHRRNRIIKSAA